MIDSPIILDERTLLNLDSKKTKTKPTLQTITIKIKNEKLQPGLCLQRVSTILLHSNTIAELKEVKEHITEYFDGSICKYKANYNNTKIAFIFEWQYHYQ